jgi:predicted ATPase
MPCHGYRRLTSARRCGADESTRFDTGDRLEIELRPGREQNMTGSERFAIVTGGPGSGKTTVIAELARRGIATSPEAGRAVIREQQAISGAGLPWADRALFAALMTAFDVKAYEAAQALAGPMVFDRGIPDVIGYLRLCGLPVPADLDAMSKRLRYRRDVFIAPPWRQIYENDAERRQDFAEACRTYDVLAGVYRDYGYELCVLPRVGVAERAEFLLDRIGAG